MQNNVTETFIKSQHSLYLNQVTFLAKLISLKQTESMAKKCNGRSCESCGHIVKNPIQLTNFSSTPMQTYNACPFCFTRLEEDAIEEPSKLKLADFEDSTLSKNRQKETEDQKTGECPHYLGYLKKRPKNTPIPDSCLTCQKMMQCLLQQPNIIGRICFIKIYS